MSVDSVTPGARTVLQIPLSGCLSPRSCKWALLACYSSEDVQQCVAEGRRRSHFRSRIARSGQDLAIRGLGMRANTAKTHSSTAYPNPICARRMLLGGYSSEDGQQCVAEGRRRRAWRGRIDRSRQDLPVRSIRMHGNTAKTYRSTAVPNPICARLACLVCYSSEDAKKMLPKVEGDALGGVESLDLDEIYRSAASECVQTQRKHTGAHFP